MALQSMFASYLVNHPQGMPDSPASSSSQHDYLEFCSPSLVAPIDYGKSLICEDFHYNLFSRQTYTLHMHPYPSQLTHSTSFSISTLPSCLVRRKPIECINKSVLIRTYPFHVMSYQPYHRNRSLVINTQPHPGIHSRTASC